jgi:CheY-like chemotaxis protein
LRKEGYNVYTANTADEGLALARSIHPAAITLDVLMPGKDGWSLLSAIKNDETIADIPVIMLTVVENKELGYTLGASEFLTKPIDRTRLLAVLRRYAIDAKAPVLIVENDLSSQEILSRMLEREGYSLIVAKNGRVALKSMQEHQPPQLILLDFMMPEMDGFQFIDEIRKHEAWRSIPVIVITAKDLTAEEQHRLNQEVKRIFQKGSFTHEQLLGEVRHLLCTLVKKIPTSHTVSVPKLKAASPG